MLDRRECDLSCLQEWLGVIIVLVKVVTPRVSVQSHTLVSLLLNKLYLSKKIIFLKIHLSFYGEYCNALIENFLYYW